MWTDSECADVIGFFLRKIGRAIRLRSECTYALSATRLATRGAGLNGNDIERNAIDDILAVLHRDAATWHDHERADAWRGDLEAMKYSRRSRGVYLHFIEHAEVMRAELAD